MPKHDRTLGMIFAEPKRANIAWKDIEALFVSLGAIIEEAEGSRVRIDLNGFRVVFHRAHPGKETSKAAVRSARNFLRMAGFASETEEE